MEPSDLTAIWTDHSQRLDRSARLDDRLVADLAARRARSRLLPSLPLRAAEATLAIALATVLLPVVTAHAEAARYALAGWLTLPWLAGFAAHALWQGLLALRIDAAAPVATTQAALLRLRRLELAALRWAVLGGVCAWLPLLALGAEAATGAAVLEHLPAPWLYANLGLGLCLWAASPALGRWLEARATVHPPAQRLLDALTSRGLRRAAAHVDELARFVSDEPPGR